MEMIFMLRVMLMQHISNVDIVEFSIYAHHIKYHHSASNHSPWGRNAGFDQLMETNWKFV